MEERGVLLALRVCLLPLPLGLPRPRPASVDGGSDGRFALVVMTEVISCDLTRSNVGASLDSRASTCSVAGEYPVKGAGTEYVVDSELVTEPERAIGSTDACARAGLDAGRLGCASAGASAVRIGAGPVPTKSFSTTSDSILGPQDGFTQSAGN
jgi:hypothetical protein